jgi:hypothetical protein
MEELATIPSIPPSQVATCGRVIDFVKINNDVAAILEDADGAWIGDRYCELD